MTVVAGVVRVEDIVIAAVQGEAVLIVEGGGVAAEKVASGGAGYTAARGKTAIHYKAEEVPRAGHILDHGIGHLFKVYAFAESGDSSRPEDLYICVSSSQSHARAHTLMHESEIAGILSDGMTVEHENDVVCLDVNAICVEAQQVIGETIGTRLRDDCGTLRDDIIVIHQVIRQESVKRPSTIKIKTNNCSA